MTHLHWLFFRGPRAMDGVRKGASLCGQFNIPAPELVSSVEAGADCPRCLELAGPK